MARAPQVDQDCCISCGNCESLCPKTFQLDPESDISQVIDPQGDSEACIQEAIEQCPAECISWQ